MLYNAVTTADGTIGYSVNYWAAKFQAAASDLPWPALAEWMRQESGGNPAALGKSYEVGLLQINTGDGPFQGYTREQLHGTGTFATGVSGPGGQGLTRGLTADEEQLQVAAAVAYAREALSAAQSGIANAGQTWADADQWALAKLWHWLPALVRSPVGVGSLADAAKNNAAASWSDYAAYLASLSKSDVPSSIQGYWSDVPAKVNACGAVGGRVNGVATLTVSGARGAVVLDLLTCLTIGAMLAVAYFFTR